MRRGRVRRPRCGEGECGGSGGGKGGGGGAWQSQRGRRGRRRSASGDRSHLTRPVHGPPHPLSGPTAASGDSSHLTRATLARARLMRPRLAPRGWRRGDQSAWPARRDLGRTPGPPSRPIPAPSPPGRAYRAGPCAPRPARRRPPREPTAALPPPPTRGPSRGRAGPGRGSTPPGQAKENYSFSWPEKRYASVSFLVRQVLPAAGPGRAGAARLGRV